MAPRKEPEAEIKCTLCGAAVTPETYAEHIQNFHGQRTTGQSQSQTKTTGPTPPNDSTTASQGAEEYPGQQRDLEEWDSRTLAGTSGPSAGVSAPPPVTAGKAYINEAIMVKNGSFTGRIVAVRDATGVRSRTRTDIQDRKGWFIDIVTDRPIKVPAPGPNGKMIAVETNQIAGRINEGDTRHQALWAKHQAAWVGKTVTVRLPMQGEATKATWCID